MLKRALYLAGQHINLHYPIYLITEKLNSDCRIIGICRKYIKHIPMHSEGASVKIHIISRILNIDQRTDHVISVLLHPGS